jgi:alpha-tubulin suppressor-like RCC1 family protein
MHGRNRGVSRVGQRVIGMWMAMLGCLSVADAGQAQTSQVWQWGAELGPRYRVPGLSGATGLSSGSFHRLVLKSDGTAWAWGENIHGQLGDGTVTYRSLPIPVVGLSHVVLIAAGYYHNLVKKADGTIWTWGQNSYGQLGDGTTTDHPVPIPVSGLTNVIALSVGERHSLALKADGTVWAWGNNEFGQLGDGTTIAHFIPAPVSGLTNVVAISAGGRHNLALKSDGTVWAWGQNSKGQLGDGTITQRSVPVRVSGLAGMIQLAAGEDYSLALKSNGTVQSWGNNTYYQLGRAYGINYLTTPGEVFTVTDILAIAASNGMCQGLKADGSVWAWGADDPSHNGGFWYGAICQVSGLPNILAVSTGFFNSALLLADGTVWACGTINSEINELGFPYRWEDGVVSNRTTPMLLSELTNISTIAAGYQHRLALKLDGTVWAWGRNNLGQLGDGTTIDRLNPAPVSGLNGVIDISAGGGILYHAHSLALKADGTVWAWGGAGAVGDGTFVDRSFPVQVSGLTHIIQIEAGQSHSLALKVDGTVWAWGDNGRGCLGDGTNIFARNTPVQVINLTDVIAVSAGSWLSLAVKLDGTVWAWGGGWAGQLGDGTTTPSRNTPVQVSGLTNVIAVAAGYSFSVALKSDGTVWAWGLNDAGQLGDGTTTNRLTPVQVSGLTDVVSISAGISYCLAQKSDGTLWGWGDNSYGQLMDGTSTKRLVPVQSRVPRVSAVATGDGNIVAILSTVSVSGALTLEDSAYDAAAQPITFTLRPVYGGAEIVRTEPVSPSGLFSLTDIPQTLYTLHIKGAQYLAANVSLDTSNGSVSGVSALLRAGDANDDNSVDVLDLDQLIQAFDSGPGAPNWNPGADFNGDGSVDVLDLDLLVRNFDVQGDA